MQSHFYPKFVHIHTNPIALVNFNFILVLEFSFFPRFAAVDDIFFLMHTNDTNNSSDAM